MASSKQYYALCWPEAKETNDTKVAFLDLGRNEFGQALGMAVFTSKERGAALLKEEPLSSLTAGNEELEINPVSAETLLHAMQIGVPNSVFLDGHKLASSVFTGILKEELGLPIKKPRTIRLRPPEEDPSSSN